MSAPHDAGQIAATIAGLGRPVDPVQITHALDGMEGLDAPDAAGTVLATYGVTPDGRATDDFTPPRSPWQALRHVLHDSGAIAAYVGVAALAGIVPALAVPLLLRVFVDRFLVAGDDRWLWPVVLGLVVAALMVAAVAWLQNWVLARLAVRISGSEQARFAWHLLRLPTAGFDEIGTASVAGRSASLQNTGIQAGMLVPFAAVNVVTAVVFAVALLLLDWTVGLVALAVCLAAMGTSLVLQRRWRAIEKAANQARVALSDMTAEIVGGIESVKAPAWEQHVFTRWAEARAESARWTSARGRLRQWVGTVPVLAPTVGLGAVLAVGAIQVIHGSLTLGTLAAAQSFLAVLLAATGAMVWVGVLIESVTARILQGDEVLSVPLDPEVVAQVAGQGAGGVDLVGDVRGHGLVFGFDRSRAPLLDGIDLHVPAGARLALVGGSGSGKTTIARLLVGEVRPWAGSVLLDGVPRLKVHRAARTRGMAYVPQTSVLFPGTIRENLTLWDPSVTDDVVARALADACVADAVAARPGGLDAEIQGRGGGFSGGELQRLAIARALTGNPRVLVLDEATSALDPVVEAEVEANLRRRGCTCIVIAHRLSTIRDADEIVVVEQGRIVQRGRFDDIAREGAFGALVHG